jgi:hypothetical protein
MKKFLVFLSLLFLMGCSVYQKVPVYQKSYNTSQKEAALSDLYWWMDSYKADSVPLSDWLTYQSYMESGYFIERVYQRKWNDKTEVVINFTTFMGDSVTYNIFILQRTKDKSQKQ